MNSYNNRFIVFFILFILTFEVNVYSQRSNIDSLTTILDQVDSDTGKIHILNELSKMYNLSSPEVSNEYASKALEISESNNYFVHLVETYEILAASNSELGYYSISLEYLFKALDIYIEECDNNRIAEKNYQIASVYNKRGENKLSVEYLTVAIDRISEVTDTLLIAHIYAMYGNRFFEENNYELAEHYWTLSRDIFIESNNKYGINSIINSYARLYEKNEQYDKAIIAYEKVLDYCSENNINTCVCSALNHIGDIYYNQKMYKNARLYYLKSLEFAYKNELRVKEQESYLLLFKLDSIEGNFKSASYNYIKYHNIFKCLSSYENETKISELHIKNKIRHKEDTIKRLIIEKRSKTEIIIATSIFVVLLLILLIVLWRFIKVKQYTNVQLEENNRIINEQKMNIEEIAKELLLSNKEIKIINERVLSRNKELKVSLDNNLVIHKKLLQSEKMAAIGILTAGIAHEINNPINFILGGVNSLMRDFQDIDSVIKEANRIDLKKGNINEKLQHIERLTKETGFDEALESIPELFEIIKLGADRTNEIIKSLGSYVRSDNENIQNLNLHKSINNSLVLLRNKYKDNIKIIESYGENIPDIVFNQSKMNQIFLNILSNAIDSIPNKGEIYIETKFITDKIEIIIKDTGIGMSKSVQRKLFDPFFTTKEEGKGMGLGLYIAYSYLLEYDGSINVVSEEGHGTEFTIHLPVVKKDG